MSQFIATCEYNKNKMNLAYITLASMQGNAFRTPTIFFNSLIIINIQGMQSFV